MARWSLHEMFPSLDIQDIPGYPNHFFRGWVNNCQNFDERPILDYLSCCEFLEVCFGDKCNTSGCVGKIIFSISGSKTKGLG
jgi:hypothetical protein